MTMSDTSVTHQAATWIVESDVVPDAAVDRVRHLVLDSIGNQFAGMALGTGEKLATWVRAQGGTPTCTITGSDLRTTAAFATLLNGATSHALSERPTTAAARTSSRPGPSAGRSPLRP